MRFARSAFAALVPLVIVAVAACSDPVPPVPQGAWTVSLVAQGPECHIAGHNASVGDVTSNNKNQIVVNDVPFDGTTDTPTVECSVTGTSSFDVTGTLSYNGDGLQISVKGITPKASVTQPVMGQVSFASTKTAGVPYVSPKATPCKFYFTAGTQETVASGRIWVAFTCDVVIEGMSTCEIKQGYAIFENCTE